MAGLCTQCRAPPRHAREVVDACHSLPPPHRTPTGPPLRYAVQNPPSLPSGMQPPLHPLLPCAALHSACALRGRGAGRGGLACGPCLFGPQALDDTLICTARTGPRRPCSSALLNTRALSPLVCARASQRLHRHLHLAVPQPARGGTAIEAPAARVPPPRAQRTACLPGSSVARVVVVAHPLPCPPRKTRFFLLGRWLRLLDTAHSADTAR
jgi:hypothetical protein